MDITKIEKGKDIVLKLSGWLDTNTSSLLGKEIDEIESFDSLTLDFDKLEYISSSGLREITIAYKAAKENNAEFQIINACEEVMNVFEITKLDTIINIKEK